MIQQQLTITVKESYGITKTDAMGGCVFYPGASVAGIRREEQTAIGV